MNLFAKQNEGKVEEKCRPQVGEAGGGMNWVIGIDLYAHHV